MVARNSTDDEDATTKPYKAKAKEYLRYEVSKEVRIPLRAWNDLPSKIDKSFIKANLNSTFEYRAQVSNLSRSARAKKVRSLTLCPTSQVQRFFQEICVVLDIIPTWDVSKWSCRSVPINSATVSKTLCRRKTLTN